MLRSIRRRIPLTITDGLSIIDTSRSIIRVRSRPIGEFHNAVRSLNADFVNISQRVLGAVEEAIAGSIGGAKNGGVFESEIVEFDDDFAIVSGQGPSDQITLMSCRICVLAWSHLVISYFLFFFLVISTGERLTSSSDTERVQVITSSGDVCPVCKVITTSTSIARGDDFAVIGGDVGVEIDLLPVQHA